MVDGVVTLYNLIAKNFFVEQGISYLLRRQKKIWKCIVHIWSLTGMLHINNILA